MAIRDRRYKPFRCGVPGCASLARPDYRCDACGRALCADHVAAVLPADPATFVAGRHDGPPADDQGTGAAADPASGRQWVEVCAGDWQARCPEYAALLDSAARAD